MSVGMKEIASHELISGPIKKAETKLANFHQNYKNGLILTLNKNSDKIN